MPSPPRILLPGTVVFITSRTEEGLPFIPVPYMSLIIESAMARAMTLYPVILCHYLWMANHFHLLASVEDPELIEKFVGRVKTEIAHAVNKLLGRRRRTIWVGDYDSPPILTFEDALEKVRYLYLNASEADVASSLNRYGRPSSWNAFTSKATRKSVPWIQRPFLSPDIVEDAYAYQTLIEKAQVSHDLVVQPTAWMTFFGIDNPGEQEIINQKLIADILRIEKELCETREGPAADETPGVKHCINRPYTPQKISRRAWRICRIKSLRITFIDLVKRLIRDGKETLKKWRAGDRSAPYPPGLAPPSFPRLTNLLRHAQLMIL